MEKTFERRIENFVCSSCNQEVKGDGYTDHCPNCLYSKHVDINPGDRASDCKGTMIPISATVKRNGYRIKYKCEECGYKHNVKSAQDDNFEVILELIQKPF